MSAGFVDHAAREAALAEVIPGDPRADALLSEARDAIYHWPPDFAGFTARLRYQDGNFDLHGALDCPSSRGLRIDLVGLEDQRWLRFQLEELVSHREAPSVSKMASRSGCFFGDWDPVYGRRLDFRGDKMASFYRVKDAKLCQIGRSYKNQSFVINIDGHQRCQERWAAIFYSAYYWERDGGGLLKAETYHDSYEEVGGVYLPLQRRVSEASAGGLRCRQIQLSDHRLLSNGNVSS